MKRNLLVIIAGTLAALSVLVAADGPPKRKTTNCVNELRRITTYY
jgi:hypothetical protein